MPIKQEVNHNKEMSVSVAVWLARLRVIPATRVRSWVGTDIYASHVAEEFCLTNIGYAWHLFFKLNDRL